MSHSDSETCLQVLRKIRASEIFYLVTWGNSQQIVLLASGIEKRSDAAGKRAGVEST